MLSPSDGRADILSASPPFSTRSTAMRVKAFWCAAIVLGACVGAGVIRADNDDDEENVAIKDLPEAVVAAVLAKFPDAKLVEAEKETENGEIVYEVEIEDGDDEIEVEVTSDGEILEVEVEDDDDGDDDK
jgi:hypothetical protein